MSKYVFTLLLLTASLAQAMPEGAEFASKWESTILPFYLQQGTAGSFQASDGVHLSYRVFANDKAKAAIVILPGRTEPAAKYAELISELYAANYAVFILDHRGQGASDRMLPDPQVGYVHKFQDYANDFKIFIDSVVKPSAEKMGIQSLYLLAHSMGAAAGTIYLEQNPSPFRGVALSSPMYEMNLGSYSKLEAQAILDWNLLLGNENEYIMGYGPFNPDLPLSKSEVTHSADRWNAYHKLISLYPTLSIGGPSYKWFQQALRVTDKVLKRTADYHAPTLILEAGEDTVVVAQTEEKFCAAVNSYNEHNCELHLYENSEHEILMEQDEIRSDAIARVLAWFQSH